MTTELANDLDATIERLRKSKREIDDADYQAGGALGRDWAKDAAEADELERIERLKEDFKEYGHPETVSAFEIARRHRFVEEMASLPDDVTVHVLPAGSTGRGADLSQLRYRDASRVEQYIDRARTASAAYLAKLPPS